MAVIVKTLETKHVIDYGNPDQQAGVLQKMRTLDASIVRTGDYSLLVLE